MASSSTAAAPAWSPRVCPSKAAPCISARARQGLQLFPPVQLPSAISFLLPPQASWPPPSFSDGTGGPPPHPPPLGVPPGQARLHPRLLCTSLAITRAHLFSHFHCDFFSESKSFLGLCF